MLEYIKKRKFCKKNGVEVESLDKKYAITKADIAKIKAYMRGDKDDLTKNMHKDIIDASDAAFPSSELKDPRLERIKQKQKKETEASENRNDYDIISKSFDMYRDDRPFASAAGNDFSRSSINPNDWLKGGSSRDEMSKMYENDEHKFLQKKSFANKNRYVDPAIEINSDSLYNGYWSPESTVYQDKHTIEAILGEITSFEKQSERQYKGLTNMDLNYKINIPDQCKTTLRETENSYKPMPLMSNTNALVGVDSGINDNSVMDIDVNSYMRFGTTPFRSGKSLGYPSTLEHSFNYITPDIQDPRHVVNDRGVPSRAFNREKVMMNNRKPM